MPTTVTVSNASQLTSALNSAVAGETIVLTPGNYGALNLSGKSLPNVTITSQYQFAAHFSSVSLTNTNHLTVNGVDVTGSFAASSGSNNLTLSNSYVENGASFNNASNVTITTNNIKGGV